MINKQSATCISKRRKFAWPEWEEKKSVLFVFSSSSESDDDGGGHVVLEWKKSENQTIFLVCSLFIRAVNDTLAVEEKKTSRTRTTVGGWQLYISFFYYQIISILASSDRRARFRLWWCRKTSFAASRTFVDLWGGWEEMRIILSSVRKEVFDDDSRSTVVNTAVATDARFESSKFLPQPPHRYYLIQSARMTRNEISRESDGKR